MHISSIDELFQFVCTHIAKLIAGATSKVRQVLRVVSVLKANVFAFPFAFPFTFGVFIQLLHKCVGHLDLTVQRAIRP